jgi:hypothetical protein
LYHTVEEEAVIVQDERNKVTENVQKIRNKVIVMAMDIDIVMVVKSMASMDMDKNMLMVTEWSLVSATDQKKNATKAMDVDTAEEWKDVEQKKVIVVLQNSEKDYTA